MYSFSKVFGPTDSVANTKTTVGSTYILKPGGPFVIKKIRVAKGNVVAAKEYAGIIIIEITGVDGTYEYAYGNGVGNAGGATAGGGGGPAEEIDCLINAPSGGTITVSVKDAEAAKDVTVELEFWRGSGRVDSYSCGGAGVDPAADTEKTVGTIKLTRAGYIKQIRYAAGNVVDAKASAGKLVIEVPGLSGPFEYAVVNGTGGDLGSSCLPADVRNVNIGPIPVNTTITVKVTHAEAMVSATASLAVA